MARRALLQLGDPFSMGTASLHDPWMGPPDRIKNAPTDAAGACKETESDQDADQANADL